MAGSMARRPFGISLLSGFLMVAGGLVFIAGLIVLAVSGIIAATPRAVEEIARNFTLFGIPLGFNRLVNAEFVAVFIGVIILIMGVIMALIGWGLRVGANLARWIAIVFFGLGALSSLSNLLSGQGGSFVSLIIDGLVVYYLFTPRVKRFFNTSI